MLKFISALVIALSSMAAFADIVYENDYGTWHLKGDMDGKNSACVLNTKWDDGRMVQFNFWPSGNTTMTVHIPTAHWQAGRNFTGTTRFLSSQYGNQTIYADMQVKESKVVIMRDVSALFFDRFVHDDTMLLFYGSTDQLAVDLTGTAALVSAIDDCKTAISYSPYPGNH